MMVSPRVQRKGVLEAGCAIVIGLPDVDVIFWRVHCRKHCLGIYGKGDGRTMIGQYL
jgi:hypothetical protein